MILPDLAWARWLVPPVEILPGVGLLALGRHPRPAAILAAFSLVFIAALTGYLAMVPTAELARSGCGCGGIVSAAIKPRPAVDLSLNVLFAALCVAMLVMRPGGGQIDNPGSTERESPVGEHRMKRYCGEHGPEPHVT